MSTDPAVLSAPAAGCRGVIVFCFAETRDRACDANAEPEIAAAPHTIGAVKAVYRMWL